jgi:hypothetical protein
MKIRFTIYPLIALINVVGAWLIFLYKSGPSVEAIAELGEFPGLAISMLAFPRCPWNLQMQAIVTVVGSTVIYLSIIEAVLRILRNRKLKRADAR